MDKIKQYRNFMKSNFFEMKADGDSDQKKGLKPPPLQKPYDTNIDTIKLPEINESILKNNNLYKCLNDRRSQRNYSEDSLSLEELSFLLWATQGVQKVRGRNYITLRPVPSGGTRHPFETYIYVNRVESLKNGFYRYLSLTHELIYMYDLENAQDKIALSVLGQIFVSQGAVIFFWSCIPYRSEWRYSIAAHKTMLLDAGHICQNLYLACEAINCGTCAIAAYDQKMVDQLLNIDGEDEYVVYIAPVGKKP